jgi:transposase-like protein
MTTKKKVPMQVEQAVESAVALDEALAGARRATGNASSSARPDPEVVAVAQRRQFSSNEKRRILALADACMQPGEIGALLRREGIYSSHLGTWRKQRAAAEQAALEPQKRGRKIDPALGEARRIEALTRENERLRRQLAQAELIIDVQKKVASLLGVSMAQPPSGAF